MTVAPNSFAPPPQSQSRRYSAFTAIVLAPTLSGELARDVARNWRGIGLRLLLMLLAVTWLIVLIKGQVGVNRFARDEFPKLADKVPPVTIDNGVASSPVEQPYEIRDEETGKRFAIVDTTGETTSMPEENRPMILLTRDKLFTWDENQHKLQEFSLKEIKHFYIDKNVVTHWVDKGKNWFLPVGFILVMIFSLLWRLFMTVIYAVIGLAFNSMFNARLSFDALMRLAVLASVPMLLLDTVLWLTPVNTACWWSMVGFGLVVVYLAMFIKANAQAAMPPSAYGYAPFPPAGAGQPPYPYPPGAAPQSTYPPSAPYPQPQYPPPQYPPQQYPPPPPQ